MPNMEYQSPLGAFAGSLYETMVRQDVEKRQAMLDALEKHREDRLEKEAEARLGLDKERLQEEKRTADLKEAANIRSEYSTPGDVVPPEEQKRYQSLTGGRSIPATTVTPQGPTPEGGVLQPYQESTGTPQSRFGRDLSLGKFSTPEQIMGAGIGAGLPPAEVGAVERFVQPKVPRKLGGTMTGQQIIDTTTPQERLGVSGQALDIDPNGRYDMLQVGNAFAFQPVTTTSTETQEQFTQDKNTGQLYKVNPDGSRTPWNGPLPKNHVMVTPALQPTSRPMETSQGLVNVQPTRPGTPIPGVRGSVRSPIGAPRRPATAEPAPGGAPAPRTAPAAGGPRAQQIMGPNGQPLWSTQGQPVTEDEAAAAGYLAYIGAVDLASKSFSGIGGIADKRTINRVREQYQEGQRTPTPQVLAQVARIADFSTLEKVRPKLEDTSARADIAYSQFNKNMRIVEDAFAKSPNTFAPAVNKVMNAVRKEGFAWPESVSNLSAQEGAIYTVVREYAKLSSGSFQSISGLTESATAEANKLLNAAQSPAQFAGIMDTMRKDAKNLNDGYHEATVTIRNRMLGLSGEEGVKPGETPGAPNKPIKLKWNADHTALVPEGSD